MSQNGYDILGLGNAIVDIIAQTPDAFIEANGLVKGAMTLIEEAPAEAPAAEEAPAEEPAAEDQAEPETEPAQEDDNEVDASAQDQSDTADENPTKED